MTVLIPSMSKNEQIAQTYKETKMRRASMSCTTVDVKIVHNSLSSRQKDVLSQMFVEAKWFYNDMVSFMESRTISDYDTSVKQVSVRMGKNSDLYEERSLSFLSASMKQKMKSDVQSSLKSLSKLKKNGRKVGNIGYSKSIHSIPLKQYGKDFSITSSSVLSLVKNWESKSTRIASDPTRC